MKSAVMSLALIACATPAPPPGDLVAANIYHDLGEQLTVVGTHLFWGSRTSVYAGKTEMFCGDLADTPLYPEVSIGVVDTVFVPAGDQVLISSAGDIGLLSCDGTFRHLATAPRPVESLAFDPATGDVAWGMVSDLGFPATIEWIHDGATHSVEVIGIAVGDLVFAGPSLFASVGSTQDGSLLRLDVATGASTQLATANEQAPRFPPQGLDSGRPKFSAGALISDERGIGWTVLRTDDFAGNERSLLVGFPGGDLPSNVQVVNIWGTTSVSSHDGDYYWTERSSDPAIHFPSPYYHDAIWISPGDGAEARYFHSAFGPTDIVLGQFTNDGVYSFYPGGDPSHLDVRRVAFADFVAGPPAARDCVEGLCN